MDKICTIDKRKIKLIYGLLCSSIIGILMSAFSRIILLPSIILLILAILVNLKYITCSCCYSIILLRDIGYSSGSKHCKNCGARIEYE